MATKKRKSKSVRDDGSMINNWTDEALAIGCKSGRDWDAWYAKFGKQHYSHQAFRGMKMLDIPSTGQNGKSAHI